MTRWARSRNALSHSRQPEEATSWNEFIAQRRKQTTIEDLQSRAKPQPNGTGRVALSTQGQRGIYRTVSSHVPTSNEKGKGSSESASCIERASVRTKKRELHKHSETKSEGKAKECPLPRKQAKQEEDGHTLGSDSISTSLGSRTSQQLSADLRRVTLDVGSKAPVSIQIKKEEVRKSSETESAGAALSLQECAKKEDSHILNSEGIFTRLDNEVSQELSEGSGKVTLGQKWEAQRGDVGVSEKRTQCKKELRKGVKDGDTKSEEKRVKCTRNVKKGMKGKSGVKGGWVVTGLSDRGQSDKDCKGPVKEKLELQKGNTEENEEKMINTAKKAAKKTASKKNTFTDRLRKERERKGIILLPKKVEKRIYSMKKAMRQKGLSGEEIKAAVRKVRRKEELLFRRQLEKRCFKCRQPGHRVSDCPKMEAETDEAVGICFKCGSTEHFSSKCLVQTSSDNEFPYAKCFICEQEGHLSRTCPRNDKGVYPKGGHCNFCGAIDHFKMDCPQMERNKKKDEEPEIMGDMMDIHGSADAEPLAPDTFTKQRKPKIVSF